MKLASIQPIERLLKLLADKGRLFPSMLMQFKHFAKTIPTEKYLI